MIVISTDGKPNSYSGKIVAFEGIDGSGKTTNLTMIQEWLEYKGYSTLWTDWGTSELCGRALSEGKDKKLMTPMTFALLQAANVADRLQAEILPHLQKGGVVLCDRWFYTSYARDVALERRESPDGKLNIANIAYYEAGMDMKLSDNRADGFLAFQARVAAEYEDVIVPEFGFKVVDADRDIDEVNAELQALILDAIGEPVREAA